MSPMKKAPTAVDKLAKYHHEGAKGQDKDGAAACSGEDRQATETAKVLEAIAALQTNLTTKIDEVKTDISLLRQDLSKVRDRVTETEARISTVEDILHPLQHTTEDMQRQIQITYFFTPREVKCFLEFRYFLSIYVNI